MVPASVSRIFFRCLIFDKKEKFKDETSKKIVKPMEVKLRSIERMKCYVILSRKG